jgi:thymidine phosphorylase
MSCTATQRIGGVGMTPAATPLRMRRVGIDTYQEMVVYLRSDCHVSRSEGFEAQSRLELRHGDHSIIATLNVVHASFLEPGQVGLSEAAWRALGGEEGAPLDIAHRAPEPSFSSVRAKIYGRPFSDGDTRAMVADIVRGRYSDIEMASLITACSGNRMDEAETLALTRAMFEAGQSLRWDAPLVADKHCVGGLPGNRTTLLVVPIIAACGLLIPKTSSRAITSPAGTADTMETLAPVALDLSRMRRVVEHESGCIVWGGAVSLSPADDLLIRVERPLGLDSDGLLVASVLSKKLAAGATHVLVDVPVGRTAKVRSASAAAALATRLENVGRALGMTVQSLVTDGEQPVGRGIGPALEARDVLAVLQGDPEAPADLRARALALAGALLDLAGKTAPGTGVATATEVLASGAAWRKFQAICDAQGGMRNPPRAAYTHVLCARHAGTVVAIDNRHLAAVAKLAGAPRSPAAGVLFHAPLGRRIEVGQPVLTLHAESPGELAYALAFAEAQHHLITVQED